MTGDINKPDDTDAGDAAGERDADERECRSDNDCARGAHQGALCDPDTRRCIYACEEGFGDCNGDPFDGCEIDLRDSIEHCGACGNFCASNSTHLKPVCITGQAGSQCDFDLEQCQAGFVDLNQQPEDGCECEITDENDPIDREGLDSNCDGVDGILAQTVFVAPSGDDGNDGLAPDTPVATIAKGLEIAAAKRRVQLLVSAGTYPESIELKDSISIYGGYEADNDWARNLDLDTRIEPAASDFAGDPAHYRSVSAVSISGPTILGNLTIVGADLSAVTAPSGASSYAVWAKDSDGLALQDTVIVGGRGAPGHDGENGVDGKNGEDATCEPYRGGAPGGANANVSPCSSPSGTRATNGSNGQPPSTAGSGGFGGEHACLPKRSSCEPSVLNGQSGSIGDNGEDGNDGATAQSALGVVDDGLWQAATASVPTDGTRGLGGGGGGAGANCEEKDACGLFSGLCPEFIDVGGSGGKGGDGGCFGSAGENGLPGGASFGVFAASSDLTIVDSRIAVGHGGEGGDGGKGGKGAAGEIGTGRQLGNNYGGTGGRGGEGGEGGDGGNGAGGCGGPSVGLALSESSVDHSTVSIDQATGSAGQPGAGAQTAPTGCDGAISKVHEFSAAAD